MRTGTGFDLTRTTLAVLSIGLLMAGSVWVLWPFAAALIWSVLIVVATWPLMRALQARLWNRRALAVTVMSVLLLLLFVVPLTLLVATLAAHAPLIAEWVRALAHLQSVTLPSWVGELPLIGAYLRDAWQHVVDGDLKDSVSQVAPYASRLAAWVVGQLGSLGGALMQFLMTVIMAAVLYLHGERYAKAVLHLGQRLGGDSGRDAVVLCSQAIRGVALGVGVTAVVQTALAALGLFLAGIPYVSVFTALMFVACIAQIGPLIVLVPAAGWLFWNDQAGWGVFMLVWSAMVGTLDNILRPMLIRRGADLPLILIFVGVVGGLISLGLVGIFVGPVLLAVTYTLALAWLEGPRQPPSDTP